MKTPTTPIEAPEFDLEQQKQLIAHQLWEDEGRPEGKAEEHWEQACLVVMSLADGESATSPIWLKRQDTLVADETKTEPIAEAPTRVESLAKPTATRRAA
jgi:Protein of unknown function (DUF2934)